MQKYIKYATGMNANDEVRRWVKTNLRNYLEKYNGKAATKNLENQDEIEHIIDYLVSDKAPKRLKSMSYEEARTNTEKWNKALIKKGKNIIEIESDVEVIKDYGDGFKMVKLVGQKAFEREGFLMRHCVASYYGKDTEIYSLRDDKNMPHCTIEKDQQIKGKGNGSIHPNYIMYIVEFLEEIGMNVSDNEMKNLGYVNVESVKEVADFGKLYQDKYFFEENLEKTENRDDIRLWSIFDLFKFDLDLKVKFNFDIKKSIFNFKNDTPQQAAEDYAQQAAEDYAQQAAEDNAKQAAGNYAKQAAEDNAQQAAEDYAQQAAGYNAKQAAGNYAKQAAGNYAKQAAGYNAKQAAEDYAQQAAGNNAQQAAGYNAQQAAGNNAKQAAGYNAQQAAGYNAKQAAGNYAKQAAGNYAKQAAGNNAQQVSGSKSEIISGTNSCILSGTESKAKADIESIIVLHNRDGNGNIIDYAVGVVGKDLKPNTWYKLQNGKLEECLNVQ
ncbi:MAG: hypothetical protein ACWGHH_06655 [Sulfurovaceae bacterium]